MPIMGVVRFERFFRAAAGLDVDKADIDRYSDFVNHKLYDLLIMAQATAKANARDVIQRADLPLTKGLQESMHQFERLDEEVDLEPVIEQLAALPPLDLTLGEDAESRLPAIVGGVSVALARTFKLVDPKVKNPATTEWERAFRIFDLLL